MSTTVGPSYTLAQVVPFDHRMRFDDSVPMSVLASRKKTLIVVGSSTRPNAVGRPANDMSTTRLPWFSIMLGFPVPKSLHEPVSPKAGATATTACADPGAEPAVGAAFAVPGARASRLTDVATSVAVSP